MTRQWIPDWLKGVAIVLMVYGHITHVGSIAELQKQIVVWIYTFHMPVFLIISGFFFRVRENTSEDLIRIVRRLMVPYIIFLCLYLLGLALVYRLGFATSNIPPATIPEVVGTIFLHPIGAYWFVHSLLLIQFSLIVAAVVKSKLGLDESFFWVFGLLLLAVLVSCGILQVHVVYFFLLGMVLNRMAGILPVSIVVGASLVVGILVFASDLIFSSPMMSVVWCLAVMTLLGGVGRVLESSSFFALLCWFGRNSLIVLVLHSMFIVGMKPVSGAFLRLDQSGVVYSICVVLITLCGCMLVARLFDLVRVSRYLFGTRTVYSPYEVP